MSIRGYVGVAIADAKVGLLRELQFRIVAFLQVIGFLVEPVVLLTVFRTVAAETGSIAGYSTNDIVAYYIVWTLVRVMNLALTPYVWEWWIQYGRVTHMLMHPVGVYWRTVWDFAGMKFLWGAMWLPVGVGLYLAFQPEITVRWDTVVFGAIALWGAFFVRSTYQFLLGLIGFWTTRVSALFQVIFTAEILLSGRLVPMEVMPSWVQVISDRLPFKWTFQFPIEALIGRLSTEEMIVGVTYQVAWTLGLGAAVAIVWKRAVRRYTAVGS